MMSPPGVLATRSIGSSVTRWRVNPVLVAYVTPRTFCSHAAYRQMSLAHDMFNVLNCLLTNCILIYTVLFHCITFNCSLSPPGMLTAGSKGSVSRDGGWIPCWWHMSQVPFVPLRLAFRCLPVLLLLISYTVFTYICQGFSYYSLLWSCFTKYIYQFGCLTTSANNVC